MHGVRVDEVMFYLNNKYLGTAERQHDSSNYVLPVDLADFGEQPVYRIDTLIRDNSGNVVIPNEPFPRRVTTEGCPRGIGSLTVIILRLCAARRRRVHRVRAT